jgi:hypothetical protein
VGHIDFLTTVAYTISYKPTKELSKMIIFICPACLVKNDIDNMYTTPTGEWVIECGCGHHEYVEYSSFQDDEENVS